MNYKNGDDELERMRERSRRGRRRERGSGSFHGIQTGPSPRAESGSGTRDVGYYGGYEDDSDYDLEYSQEEYGHEGHGREDDYEDDYDDPEDRGNYGYENGYDDEFGHDGLKYEPEHSRTRRERTLSGRTSAVSSGTISSKGKASSRNSPRNVSRNPSRDSSRSGRSGRPRDKGVNKDSRERNQDPSMGTGQRQGEMARQRKKKRKPWKGILLLLLIGVVGYGAWLFLKRPTGIWNVAIFGVDSRDGNTKNALADVQMICSINRSTGEIKLVSVYRDTYLKINAKGTYHKINEAYFKGGHKQAVDALEENLDLKIDDYATFNWKSVAEAINILGGVDIDITPAEFKYINAFITETVNSTGIGSVQLKQPGPNHLDGVQAVAYSRLRLMDTDFQRTERQRKVMGLVLEKAKKADLSTLTSLVTSLIPQITTSISPKDVLPMVKDIKKYHIGDTAGFPFSRQTKRIGKMDCVVPTTLESNVIQLHQFLYGEDTSYTPSSAVKKISAHISEETGLYENGKPAPSGGGSKDSSKGSSGDKGKKPDKTAPSKEKEPETTPAETSPTEESTQDSTEEMTVPSKTPVDEDEMETETQEIGPGIPTKPSMNPGWSGSEESGPGQGNASKPTGKPGNGSSSSQGNKPAQSPGSNTESSPTKGPGSTAGGGPGESPDTHQGNNGSGTHTGADGSATYPGSNGSGTHIGADGSGNPGIGSGTGQGVSGPGEIGPGV